MGLASRKQKQRIPADPRNLAWADDASKFGSSYLAKFGWDPSKGLGAAGDGRTSHIKVSHKLDMLGIGAAHQKDPNGIAWQQNKDFENLLKRLNEGAAAEEGAITEEDNAKLSVDDENESPVTEKKRKRKKDQGEVSEEKAKKKRRKSETEDKSVETPVTSVKTDATEAPATPVAEPAKPYIPRHRAHRARAIASKSIASKPAAAISEILGIAPTPSASPTPSGAETPRGKLTPLDDDAPLEKLTTSTKSVADYFKEKLLARSSNVSGSTTPVTPTSEKQEEGDSYDATRGGIGSSRLRLRAKETLDVETQKMGISKFSSLMSSTFLAATSTFSMVPPRSPNDPLSGVIEPVERQREKKRKKSSDEKDGADQAAGLMSKEKRGKREKRKEEEWEIVVRESSEQDEKKRAREERKREKAAKKARKEKRRAHQVSAEEEQKL